MWPVVLPNSSSALEDSSFPSPSQSGDPLIQRFAPDSFLKDGRKIHVGDCALFKPPIASLPFIGIIRKLTADKEGNLSIGVNWLYRPSDVKLGKGVLLEAAPNEVFYSFHKDVIPAGSLLHPCKVAFLRKGAELPSGVSSFVCRRVYDTENKCLWWLTDKDYVEVSAERQEEVDKLLNKTRLEMHGVVQSGGRSPKPLNGPISTSQVKPSSDSVQNSGSLSSQVKGKKRDRSDQGSDPSKRELLHKTEHGDIGQGRNDHMLKSEIAKITDRGGLVDFGGVEKLVQLMQPNKADKRIDIAGRIMLADVISVTDRFDCLEWFVQLKGLSVLDDWLQEVHKGKIGDISNAKETEKAIEELLLALLRALDKLPVNLHALQTCNVGKSVNHLRTHKGVEISKKARSLVDTWKKRVEAEMNMNDTKSGQTRGVSWPSKPAASEGSQVGNRKSGSSVKSGLRSSITQSPASKGSQAMGGSGEGIDKLSASGSIKPATAPAVGTLNNPIHKMLVGAAASDQPLTPIKEERSSSSSQSQNNSLSCSGDQLKTAGNSCKEDARSSTTGSVSKSSSGASRHRKSSNGVHTSAVSAAQRENASTKVISSNRNSSSEKSSPTGVAPERLTEMPVIDHGTNQRLIVRLPNTGHSPSIVASVSSYEDPSVTCGKPFAFKHDNKDRRARTRNEQRSDMMTTTISGAVLGKDGLGETNNGNALIACNEQLKASEDIVKPVEVSKATGSFLAAVERSGKAYDASLSSMNALVESCVKISEACASTSPEDDGGMNLLASVAAGEIVKSDYASSASPQRHSPIREESSSVNDENKVTTVVSEDIKEECCGSAINSPPMNKTAEVPAPGPKAEEHTCDSLVVALPLKNEGHMEVEGANYSGSGWVESRSTPDSKLQVRSPVPKADMKLKCGNAKPAESCTVALSEPLSCAKTDKDDGISLSEMDVPEEHDNEKRVVGCNNIEEKPSTTVRVQVDSVDRKGVEADQPTYMMSKKFLTGTKKEATHNSNVAMGEAKVGLRSSVLDHNVACTELKSGRDEAPGPSPHLPSSLVSVEENETSATSRRSKVDKNELDGTHEPGNADAQLSSSVGGSSFNVKLDFDLNEGFPADDDNTVAEPTKLATYGISSANPSYLVRPPISSSASITWAAAAKGSFFPPENLLRGKGEIGWKGSAATSAFRPAEPRKSLDMPVNTTEGLAVETSKPGRRLLDFDLNVADERLLEDVASPSSAQASCSESGPRDRASSGLDLDLNRVDENPDANPFLVTSTPRLHLSAMSNRPLSLPGGPSNGVSNSSRDFDLNNGPGVEEVGAEMVSRNQSVKGGFPFPSSAAAVRVNGAELGNFSSWFPHTNSYSAITVPSVLPGRGEQNFIAAAGSQRILAPPSSSTSFGLEMYRAPVLPSSPAVPFPSSTPFPYSGFPFDTSFPPTSSFSGASAVYGDTTTGGPHCFPTISSQLVGPSGVLTSPYARPFMMSLPGVASSVGSDVRKWAGPIDLNSGPGGSDGDRRDDRLPSSGRQHPASGSQNLTDEQLKAYQLGGGVAAAGLFKRKEPEGGWDAADRFSYKQASWQ